MSLDSNRWLRDSLGGLALTFALLAGLSLPIGVTRADVPAPVPTPVAGNDACIASCVAAGNSLSDCTTGCAAAGGLSYCTNTKTGDDCPGWCFLFFWYTCEEWLDTDLGELTCQCVH